MSTKPGWTTSVDNKGNRHWHHPKEKVMVTYEEYDRLCGQFREPYHPFKEKLAPETILTYTITEADRRLIWLSLAASKAQLKEYDPKKGLNQ